MRRLTLLLAAAALLAAPDRPRAGAARLPGASGGLVALAAGPGTAYAVVATRARTKPFRLVRSDGRRRDEPGRVRRSRCGLRRRRGGGGRPAHRLRAADQRRLRLRVQRPRRRGGARGGDRPAGAGARRHDADRGLPGRRRRRRDLARRSRDRPHAHRPGAAHHPARRGRARDGSPLVLARVQSRSRTQLRVLGARRAGRAGRLVAGRRPLEASLARDARASHVAYRDGARRLSLASAGARARPPAGRTGGCACAARSTGPRPSPAAGSRTIVATSQRVRRRYRIFLSAGGARRGRPANHSHAGGRIRPRPARRDRRRTAGSTSPGPTGRAARAPRRGVAPSALRRPWPVVGLAL